MRHLRLLCVAFVLLLCVGTTRADSWSLPTREEYLSAKKTVRLTVVPRELSSQLHYFQDQVDGKKGAGQQSGSEQTQARGILERKGRDGRWHVIWDKPLANDVAPTHALVSDSARHVVTFDNWHSVGFGSDVVVIYDAGGVVIRSLELKDFLTEAYIKALPRTVSSLWWSGKHRFESDEEVLLLQIVVPSEKPDTERPNHVEISVRLSDGKVIPPNGRKWERALAAAAQVNAANEQYERAEAARRAAPLYGPKSEKEEEWYGYLVDAYFRLETDREDGYPETHVLRPRRAADYAQSVEWIRESLSEKHDAGEVIMFASPSQEQLSKVLIEAAGKVPLQGLKGVRVYVAVGAGAGQRIEQAFAHTGADYRVLDPSKPIPPRNAGTTE